MGEGIKDRVGQEYSEILVKERDKAVLERNTLREQQKKITDSLKYASIIQEALLPPKEFIHELFPDSFLFYQPKDIVSGDFYWLEQFPRQLHKVVAPNNRPNFVMLAAVDCTGHGVPGAFMSILGKNFLHHATVEHQYHEPADALNEIQHNIRETFQSPDGNLSITDGMDMSLVKIDLHTYKVTFSGAKRPLFYTQNGILKTAKADRISIGGRTTKQQQHFTQQEIQLSKGDALYLFTDGITDQLGEDLSGKFLIKRFRELLQANHHAPMQEQQQIIEQAFATWKQTEVQTDDVLVLGVRL